MFPYSSKCQKILNKSRLEVLILLRKRHSRVTETPICQSEELPTCQPSEMSEEDWCTWRKVLKKSCKGEYLIAVLLDTNSFLTSCSMYQQGWVRRKTWIKAKKEAVFYQCWQGNRISQSKVAVDSLFCQRNTQGKSEWSLLTSETSHKLKHVYGPGGKAGCVKQPSDRERTISQ